MILIRCLALLLFCCSCSKPCHQYEIMGADEFVIDSYKIRQGKLAILEMEGVCSGELDPCFMEEYKDVIAEDDILNIILYHPTRKDLTEAVYFINQTQGGFKIIKGCVDLPEVPPIYVNGLTLEEAREKIRTTFNEQIRDVEAFVTYKDRTHTKGGTDRTG